MRTATLLIASLLTASVAQARPIVWHHIGDGKLEEVPNHEQELREEEALVDGYEMAVERRKQAIQDRKDDKKAAKKMKRQARKDLRTAKKELRQADRNAGNAGMKPAIAQRAAALRNLEEAKDYVDLQKERITAARQHKQLDKARLSYAIAQREYAAAFLVSRERGTDWQVPSRFSNQKTRINDEVLDDLREWELARTEVREASQDHWSWDDEATFARFYTVPVYERVTVIDGEPAGQKAQLQRLYFDLDEHHVKAEYKDELARNAEILRNNRDVTIRVEGHTDATGPNAYNMDLAWDRAEAVAANLRQMGVWDSQIETVAFGEGHLAIKTDGATQQNRRVELRVVSSTSDALVDGTVDDSNPYGEPMDERYDEDMN